ncbi:hypothetical protein E2C01_054939 [Portunus trituberculatus]|uniref:Uncharacterized protein n=1 Tax=Portunus trituberculatus TaxID=210409 RepID=A0A5B7GKY5_PORTR|nr:hypothetical protein [Portunus trituberculatus]
MVGVVPETDSPPLQCMQVQGGFRHVGDGKRAQRRSYFYALGEASIGHPPPHPPPTKPKPKPHS